MKAVAIHNQGPELRADSREIAKFFEVEHESIARLLHDNAEAFESFGSLRFEIGVKAGDRGGEKPKFAYLTEPQVAYLLTLTRNTDRTKALKLQLIQSFQRVRAQLRPVDSIPLSIPEPWQKVFPDDFYRALLRVYGHDFNRANGTPGFVGGFTNRYVYGPLWDGLPTELKAKRIAAAEDADDAQLLKLHQFLEANSKQALERHILRVTTLLQSATSPEEFKESFARVCCGESQMPLLFGTAKKGRAA